MRELFNKETAKLCYTFKELQRKYVNRSLQMFNSPEFFLTSNKRTYIDKHLTLTLQ